MACRRSARGSDGDVTRAGVLLTTGLATLTRLKLGGGGGGGGAGASGGGGGDWGCRHEEEADVTEPDSGLVLVLDDDLGSDSNLNVIPPPSPPPPPVTSLLMAGRAGFILICLGGSGALVFPCLPVLGLLRFPPAPPSWGRRHCPTAMSSNSGLEWRNDLEETSGAAGAFFFFLPSVEIS